MSSEYQSINMEECEENLNKDIQLKDALRKKDTLKIKQLLEENSYLIDKSYQIQNINHKKEDLLKIINKLKIKTEERNEITEVILKFRMQKSKYEKDGIFYAAAIADYEKLINYTNEELYSQTKDGFTVLAFMIKYGALQKDNYMKCLNFVLEKSKSQINRLDYSALTPLDLALKKKNKSVIDILKEKGALTKNETKSSTIEKTKEIVLFEHIITNQKAEVFEKCFQDNLKDCNDGENTLLQLSIIRGNLPIFKFLMNSGSDPNLTGTNSNSPLLLAAMKKQEKIFNELLLCKKLSVTEDDFQNFIALRGKGVPTKYVDMLLEWKHLPVDLKSSKNSTPLHYAIMFENQKAINCLLKRGASLLAKNDAGSTCLSLINPLHLENHLNSCLLFDNYKESLGNINYKLQFDFRSLIDNGLETLETEVVQEIGSNGRLKHLLRHVIIDAFVHLKWNLCFYYYALAVAYKLIYVILGVLCFYVYADNYTISGWLSLLLTVFQIPVATAFFHFKIFSKNNFHSFLEAFLLFFLFCSFMMNVFSSWHIYLVSSFSYIIISLSLLLTVGYSITLTKWSAMLQRIYKKFFKILLIFLIMIGAFALGFHQLLQVNEERFDGIFKSIFTTFTMLSGDLNSGDLKLKTFEYLFFLTFVLSMGIVLMNFWIGAAVSDIEKVEKESEVAAFNNILIFIQLVEILYTFLKKYEKIRYLPNPLLVDKEKEEKIRYKVDYYINKDSDGKQNLKRTENIDCKIRKMFEEKNNVRLEDVKCHIEHMRKDILSINDFMKKDILSTNDFMKKDIDNMKRTLEDIKRAITGIESLREDLKTMKNSFAVLDQTLDIGNSENEKEKHT